MRHRVDPNRSLAMEVLMRHLPVLREHMIDQTYIDVILDFGRECQRSFFRAEDYFILAERSSDHGCTNLICSQSLRLYTRVGLCNVTPARL